MGLGGAGDLELSFSEAAADEEEEKRVWGGTSQPASSTLAGVKGGGYCLEPDGSGVTGFRPSSDRADVTVTLYCEQEAN